MTAAVAERLPRVGALPLQIRHERLALGLLLAGTAALYVSDLGASGYSNDYYSAAVQSMTRSWKAFLFGSFDTGNILTTDKPPASLWLMTLSARIFGLSSWSLLVPIALTGVATVALLYAAVRRVSGPHAALLAGTVMALTPVAVLMFRINNPDALVTLMVVAAAYATVRAIEAASTWWLLLAGLLVGFGFLAKMGQAFVVVPGLALAYLVAAPTGWVRRIRQLVGSGIAIVVGAGWWVAITELWPAGDRPYISGTATNSVLELALGYNGLGRLLGDSKHGTSGGERGGGFASDPGLLRMFSDEVGSQVAWLLPAALILLLVGLWLTRRAPRTDRLRASLLLWGAWTIVTAAVFSLAAGDFHAYYTVTLAPGVAGLVGMGGYELWKHRATLRGRAALALIVALTALWAVVLLHRSPDFLPWLSWAVALVGLLAVVTLLAKPATRHWATITATLVMLTGLLAPAAYAVDTVTTPQTGGKPSAGPEIHHGGKDDADPQPKKFEISAPGGDAELTTPQLGLDPAVVTLLQQAGTKWSAATVGGRDAAVPALASRTPVMCIGGFSGTDPAPTLDQFQGFVAAREVRYFILPEPSRRFKSPITKWVQANYSDSVVGGQTLYDLTRPTQPQPGPAR
ncbi:glycosyltransferase family 39 protein [Pseudonocardia alaniniphila]|uniref:Glycosyltransferase family 39 protein n=1 Tax=Pseudonocardia alaniniphila TaxID=75291 RepID=A0ABS9T9W7_9PSEU|nr:glycosyltransferase family 39 protein [Pseudonocardia alaniniphila]MCH6165333.1 glycosyltransferase family 39 protein [Pseudonocardia alaniniphila]